MLASRDIHVQTVADFPGVARNSGTTPDTQSARKHESLLIRTALEIGYSTIARAAHHDKAWVCRWLQGEATAKMPELLAWLDACHLQLVERDDSRDDDIALLQILLRKAASAIDARTAEPIANPVQVAADDYRALLALAKRGIQAMQAAQP